MPWPKSCLRLYSDEIMGIKGYTEKIRRIGKNEKTKTNSGSSAYLWYYIMYMGSQHTS